MQSLMSDFNEVKLDCYDMVDYINSITPLLMLICFLFGVLVFSKKGKAIGDNDKINNTQIEFSIENFKEEEHFFS